MAALRLLGPLLILVLLSLDGLAKDEISIDTHKRLAKQTNTAAWKLLDRKTLNQNQRDRILYLAFASAYHWSVAGKVVNQQRAEWLISRVYVKLNRGSAALHHAKRCLQITLDNSTEIQNFDTAYAFEAMARANAFLGKRRRAMDFYKKAIEAARKIVKEEDRKLFLSDLTGGKWYGLEL